MREKYVIQYSIIILLFIFSFTKMSFSQSSTNDKEVTNVFFTDTELRTIKSDYVDQTYYIEIYLPPSYSDSLKSFPVVYLLDSDISFGMAKNIIDFLLLGREIPEIMLVGISYREGFNNWWTKRSRDYTPSKDTSNLWGEWPLAGGAVNFTKFIKNELIPFINSNYRVIENNITIAGISFGGLFASYVLFTEPTLFNNYIMSGSALMWDNKLIFNIEAEYSENNIDLPVKFYTSVGELDDPSIIEPWNEFNKILENRKYSGFKFKNELLNNETHFSVWPSSLTRGLKFIFSANE